MKEQRKEEIIFPNEQQPLTQETKEYIQKLFQRRSLETILTSVSIATEKGYFNYHQRVYYADKAAKMNFWEFVEESQSAWRTHILLSNHLLEITPSINTNPPLKRCPIMLPLLRTALENDARTMGFSVYLNERKRVGRFSEAKNLLTAMMMKIGLAEGKEELINIFLTPYVFSSFGVEFAYHASRFFSETTPEFTKAISNPDLVNDKIQRNPNDFQLVNLADKYTYGDISQLLPKLQPFTETDPTMMIKTIDDAKFKSRYRYQWAKTQVENLLLDPKERETLNKLLNAIQLLLYSDHYLEEQERFNLGYSMGDYLLRDLTASTLWELDCLETADPMATDQTELLNNLFNTTGGVK